MQSSEPKATRIRIEFCVGGRIHQFIDRQVHRWQRGLDANHALKCTDCPRTGIAAVAINRVLFQDVVVDLCAADLVSISVEAGFPATKILFSGLNPEEQVCI
jgi:hypothetical protein